MKLIIDIPEETYNALNNSPINDRRISVLDTLYAVRCGIPLPAEIDRIKTAIEQEADYQDEKVNHDIARGMYLALSMFEMLTNKESK